MIHYYTKYRCDSVVSWTFPLVNSKEYIDFAMVLTLRENLLKPSGFCNAGVKGSLCIKKNGQQKINPAAPGIIDTHV